MLDGFTGKGSSSLISRDQLILSLAQYTVLASLNNKNMGWKRTRIGVPTNSNLCWFKVGFYT